MTREAYLDIALELGMTIREALMMEIAAIMRIISARNRRYEEARDRDGGN